MELGYELHTMLDRLKAKPGLVCGTCEIGSPLSEEAGMLIEMMFSLNPATQAPAILEANGVIFNWEYVPPNTAEEPIRGRVNIPPLLDLLSNPAPSIESSDIFSAEAGTYSLVKLDELSEDLYILWHISGDSSALWYWDENGDKYPLTLQLDTYFYWLTRLYGLEGWHLFFIDCQRVSDLVVTVAAREHFLFLDHAVAQLEFQIKVLSSLFPEVDQLPLRDKLNEIQLLQKSLHP